MWDLILEPKICAVIMSYIFITVVSLTDPVVKHDFGTPLSAYVMYNLSLYFLDIN